LLQAVVVVEPMVVVAVVVVQVATEPHLDFL
jgi:hypothetical protein